MDITFKVLKIQILTGRISTYSHKHLKTWAYLQPVV